MEFDVEDPLPDVFCHGFLKGVFLDLFVLKLSIIFAASFYPFLCAHLFV